MLGDNAEKSKNPLKKAMRRRNAKTVTFSSPTYFEASDVEFSTDEEDDGDEQFFEDEDATAQDTQEDTQATENMTVEPLRLKPRPEAAESTKEAETAEKPASPEKERTSEELVESQRMLNLIPYDFSKEWANLGMQRIMFPDPGMVSFGTPIRSLRMIVLRRRRYLSHPTSCAMIRIVLMSQPNLKR